MAPMNGDTVKRMARDIFDYEISDSDANAMANSTGAILTLSRHLGNLGLSGIEPPFGYANLLAEAGRLNGKKD
jgi:hypothetical protein